MVIMAQHVGLVDIGLIQVIEEMELCVLYLTTLIIILKKKTG